MKNISFKTAKNDIIAGIIVALVSIPISMGYAQIAGLPAAYGLYGSLLPVLVYAFTTSSPQFVFGVDATPAVLVGGTLAALGVTTGSDEAMRLVPAITLVVAAWLLIFSLIKAGRIVNYISTPVMGGFISGIGITIILMQVPKLFGGTAGTGELIELILHITDQLKYFNVLSAVLGFGTVVIILVCKKYMPKFPMSVVLMVLGAMATAFLHIDRFGVKHLPHVDAGFPKLFIPDVTLLRDNTSEIVVLGLTCALVIMAQTLLATNNYANRYGYKVDNNREVLAYSLANVASAVSGSCPLNGSVSRTGIADQFGCKTQLMSVTAAVTMLVVVLFATPLLEYLPVPILTGIVVAALIGIVEYKLADKLRKVNRAEFFIFLAAMFGVLLFGTIYGVIIGVILSFIAVIIRAVVPPRSLLGCIPGHEGFYNLNRNRNALEIQHVVMYRFSGNLFFANVSTFLQDIENAIKDDTRVVIVDASGIGSIDITAADRLVSFNKILKDKGLRFYITEHVGNVNDQLRKLGAGCLVEEGVTRRTISLALRDAGVDRPYPLAGTLEQTEAYNDFIEDNERLAEIEWAFGEDASEWLDKFAVQMTDDITHMDENNEHIPDNVLAEAESKNTWGRIGLFDEDELLERVEMHLSELTQNNSNAEELEERIEERRLRLEAKIAKLNPDALAHLRQHRREVMLHFKENNPEAYKHMMERRMEHISKLEKENPELAAKMKKLYKLDDIAGDYSSVKER
uniref:SulP family inorganic anion transporter n=1 Tax=Lachnospira sp. TaxID=2049031 RepID=UPI004026A6F3